MLTHLHIRNFTLIDTLDVDFREGFSVITGETGAGKSIILGALTLLMGQRAEARTIKNGCDRCTIEAHFTLDDNYLNTLFDNYDIDYEPQDTILRRDINSNGKSRAFINDTPVQLNTMKDIGEKLIDIHSQHQNLLLQSASFQLSVIDAMAADRTALEAYQDTFRQWHDAQHELDTLRQSLTQAATEADFLRFQVNELEEAHLIPDEKETLEDTAHAMANAEEIKASLSTADSLLNGDNAIVEQLHSVCQAADSVSRLYPTLIGDISDRLHSSYIEIKDIAGDISRKCEQADFDPNEAERINNRLDTLNSLLQKYRCTTVEALIDHHATLQQRLDSIDQSDEHIAALEQQVNTLYHTLEQQAATLTALRTKAATDVERTLIDHLKQLGMPHVRFQVTIQPKMPTIDGADSIDFRFTANKNTPLQPLAQIASGGETARVMLALKALLSHKDNLPTLIFDEIDTGVSGHMAERMALIMQQMADKGRQIITITHLPQIAAQGEHHYRVYKDEDASDTTVTHMQQLDDNGRITEIAQMLSGADITQEALDNARVLLRK